MPLVAQVFAVIAALLHVLFFYLESIAWRKGAWKSFGVTSQADADVVAPMALNQGFYNLFLAIGVIIGVVFDLWGESGESGWTAYAPLSEDTGLPFRFTMEAWGTPLAVFGLAVMLGAAVVLLVSSKGRLLRGVVIQGLAPAIALFAVAVA